MGMVVFVSKEAMDTIMDSLEVEDVVTRSGIRIADTKTLTFVEKEGRSELKYKRALEKIVRVSGMGYEYRSWAKEALMGKASF